MLGFDIESFCSQTGGVLQFVGWVLTIIKIAMPLIIIAYGILDLGKAVTASKEEEIKTAAKRLMFRAIAGIAIFFVPSLIMWIFGAAVSNFSDQAAGFDNCTNCVLKPWGDECKATSTTMQY